MAAAARLEAALAEIARPKGMSRANRLAAEPQPNRLATDEEPIRDDFPSTQVPPMLVVQGVLVVAAEIWMLMPDLQAMR